MLGPVGPPEDSAEIRAVPGVGDVGDCARRGLRGRIRAVVLVIHPVVGPTVGNEYAVLDFLAQLIAGSVLVGWLHRQQDMAAPGQVRVRQGFVVDDLGQDVIQVGDDCRSRGCAPPPPPPPGAGCREKSSMYSPYLPSPSLSQSGCQLSVVEVRGTLWVGRIVCLRIAHLHGHVAASRDWGCR